MGNITVPYLYQLYTQPTPVPTLPFISLETIDSIALFTHLLTPSSPLTTAITVHTHFSLFSATFDAEKSSTILQLLHHSERREEKRWCTTTGCWEREERSKHRTSKWRTTPTAWIDTVVGRRPNQGSTVFFSSPPLSPSLSSSATGSSSLPPLLPSLSYVSKHTLLCNTHFLFLVFLFFCF